VYERNGKPEKAIETCVRAHSLIRSSDAEQVIAQEREFDITYARLSGRPPEDATGELFDCALREQRDDNSLNSASLFGEAWDNRVALNQDSDAFATAVEAGVGWAAHVRVIKATTDAPADVFDHLSERVDSMPDVEATLSKIESHTERLTPPARAIFELLRNGETNTDPAELRGSIDDENHDHEALKTVVFAELLENLERVSGTDEGPESVATSEIYTAGLNHIVEGEPEDAIQALATAWGRRDEPNDEHQQLAVTAAGVGLLAHAEMNSIELDQFDRTPLTDEVDSRRQQLSEAVVAVYDACVGNDPDTDPETLRDSIDTDDEELDHNALETLVFATLLDILEE